MFSMAAGESRTSEAARIIAAIAYSEWKWEHITMDFLIRLSRSQKCHYSICVTIVRLTKSTHFLPVNSTYTIDKYAHMYVDEIICYMGYCCQLYQIDIQRSLINFGLIYRMLWALV